MLSIIIPSYKGAKTLNNQLPGFIEYLKTRNFTWEIIIVDDGSNDNGATKSLAEKLNCRYLENPVNMGKGAAVRNGMVNAKGDYRIFTDVDIPFEYESFDQFLYYLDFKEFDIVVGDRTLPGSNYFTEISRLRKIGSAIFSFLVGRFVTTGLFDTQCGMKGFKGKIANEIFGKTKINGFAFDVEVIYLGLKYNLDIKRLPVKLRCQDGSSVSVLRHGTGMLIDVLKIKWNHLRGKYKRI